MVGVLVVANKRLSTKENLKVKEIIDLDIDKQKVIHSGCSASVHYIYIF